MCVFAFLPQKRDGILDPVQIYVGFFVFVLLGIAASNFVFAKIPKSRLIINKFLGETFVGDHQVNMKGVQFAKAAIGGVAALAVVHGDNMATSYQNAQDLHRAAEIMQVHGITVTPEHAERILNKPSSTQQILTTGLDVTKTVAKAATENLSNKPK